MDYFEKLTIKQKFLFPSVMVMVGFGIIFLVYQYGADLREDANQQRQQIVNFDRAVTKLWTNVLQSEVDENVFRLGSKIEIADQFMTDMARSDVLVDKLGAMAPNANMLNNIRKSKRLLNIYKDRVNSIIASKKSLGLDETTGLLGGLRKAVHEVESTLLKYGKGDLLNSMLLMRRHEKDFLMRRADKYVTKMRDERSRFSNLLKKSSLPIAEITIIERKMDQYHQGFLAMVEGVKKVQIDAKASAEAVQLLKPEMARLVNASQSLLMSTQQQLAEEEAQINNIFYTTMGIIGMIIVLLVGLANRMLDNLSGLIFRVQESSIKVASSVTEIASATREQEASATEHAATTSEVAASIKEISSTSKHLGQTTDEVAHLAQDTALSASDGQVLLNSLDATMNRMARASGSISDKLATLSEKAGNIGSMVTTINKVADQTNLLSLNAAIEAEKAGEYGRGFAVVATEIRRLADQTAVATYDIEQMVGEVQSAVSAGVMGMDKFSEEIHSSVEEAKKAGVQLEKIIEQVQALAPHIESVNEGLQGQIEGAGQIDEAMINLSEAAQQSAEIIRQSNSAISGLNDAARRLQDGAAIFKVKS